MSSNSVTLIVLNYNDSQTTVSYLNRIREYSSINRIVVVDNHSTDDSFLVLKNYENHKIRVIQTPYNGGYGYGNNFGIRYANELDLPEYIIISNPDVIFDEKIIEEMIESISEEEKYTCVAPMMLDVNGNKVNGTAWKVPTAFQYTVSSEVLINRFFTLNKYKSLKDSETKGSIEVECLAGSFFMVKTIDMLKYGMYDENMFLYCEETYLGLQMKKNNRQMLLLTDLSFVHAHGVSINKTYKSAIKKQWMVWKNKEYLMKNYMGCSRFNVFLSHAFFCLCSVEQYFLMLFHIGA